MCIRDRLSNWPKRDIRAQTWFLKSDVINHEEIILECSRNVKKLVSVTSRCTRALITLSNHIPLSNEEIKGKSSTIKTKDSISIVKRTIQKDPLFSFHTLSDSNGYCD